MSRSRTAFTRSGQPANLPLVCGCIADRRGRLRIQGALRDVATVLWFETFVELRSQLEIEQRRVMVVVIDVEDRTGASAAAFARDMSESFAGVGVVAYRKPARDSQADVCLLGAAGVHDLLIAGVTDEGFTARTIILDACRRGAADLVMTELTKILPVRLQPFADAVIRNPAKGTIGKITAHLSIHRQTPNSWCRKERYLRPEELLVWCRIFLVSALLELTPRTLDSISNELEYASATSLRNQLKNYTGMTATQVRDAGMAAVLTVFAGRVLQARSGYAGSRPAEPEAADLSTPAIRHIGR
jgi:hypothetical protein